MVVQPSRIVFERRLPTEARREQEDWGGLSDARARRRLQNRLNQRSYRRRRAAERAARRASAACSPHKPVPLAPREPVPTAHQKGKVIETASKRDAPCPENPLGRVQVDLCSQTVLQQTTSPVPGCAVLLSNPQVRRVHHYALTTLWPSFRHHSLETDESLTSAFFHLSMVDDLLLNSFVWTAALVMSMHLPQTAVDNDAVMFTCQNRAVQSIREHIERNEISDSVIFAVLGLTIRDTNPRVAMQERGDDCFGGFDPPLRSLGWIQYFSHFRWTPSHIRAAKSLVAARGGLQHITTPGVAEQIQSTDILQASLSLGRPHFALCRLYQHVLDNHVRMIRPPRERLNEAFPALGDVDFKDLLLDMRMYCRDLDRVAAESGVSASGDDADLVPASVAWETHVYRNLIQYRLLRLPRYESPEEELCRLGAMVFSYGVIFPVARPEPSRALVKQLRTALGDHVFCPSTAKDDGATMLGENEAEENVDADAGAAVPTNAPSPPVAFLLWLAVLGALASKNTDDGPFFLNLVSTWSTRLGVVRFARLRTLMRSFLWLERACDKGAFGVWTTIRAGIVDDDEDDNGGVASSGLGLEKADGRPNAPLLEQQKDGVGGSLHLMSLICAG
ncbi:hypothetical protein CLAIMM_07774 [Cladophialophora immunda]|nr:hypothetical protein CLAIMM_07774 [Cladophialophora immunda]